MNAITFDTLRLAERLQAGGFTPEQAKTASAALSESMGEGLAAQQLATKADLAILKTDLAALRAELKTDLAEMKAELIKWVVGIGFAQVAMILAVLKLI